MNSLDDALKQVAVIGAAGKMGRGIALLLLQEMAQLEVKKLGKTGSGQYRLMLIDANDQGFLDLKHFLKSHLTKYAEKKINSLRECYADNPTLISNAEIIQTFIEGAMDNLYFDTEIHSVGKANLIFEAIVEDIDTKVRLFSTLKTLCNPNTIYLSNTSSIPISFLKEKAELSHIAGFHFYNPPHIQKLVELIYPNNVDPALRTFTEELGKRLKKTLVVSKDVAGFIGNGHFLREASFACQQVEALSNKHSLPEAIYLLNSITQHLLVRPMGIFQLLDYVGLDVCANISKIMTQFNPHANLNTKLIDHMLAAGIRGGQQTNGSQRDGFLKYEKNIPVGVYSLKEKKYISFQENPFFEKCDQLIEAYPKEYYPWKTLVKDSNRQEKLSTYFKNLFEENTVGANLAKTYLQHSAEIAKKLVQDGVASSTADVNSVLENGFFHLYGPENVLSTLRSIAHEATT